MCLQNKGEMNRDFTKAYFMIFRCKIISITDLFLPCVCQLPHNLTAIFPFVGHNYNRGSHRNRVILSCLLNISLHISFWIIMCLKLLFIQINSYDSCCISIGAISLFLLKLNLVIFRTKKNVIFLWQKEKLWLWDLQFFILF